MKSYKFDFDAEQDFESGQKMMALDFEQRMGLKHLIRADFCPTFCDSEGRRIVYREEIASNVGE